ncbi:hypothetical protein HMPREF0307_00690 [Corynebacterium sp. DNF00584]|nr:hypothetical protein HMPREF0307_00690 [Corynebacterium sp. DNF00584]
MAVRLPGTQICSALWQSPVEVRTKAFKYTQSAFFRVAHVLILFL